MLTLCLISNGGLLFGGPIEEFFFRSTLVISVELKCLSSWFVGAPDLFEFVYWLERFC